MTCPHKENRGPAFSLTFQRGSLKSWQLTCKSPRNWDLGHISSASPDVNPFLLCNAEDNLLLRNRYSHTNIC